MKGDSHTGTFSYWGTMNPFNYIYIPTTFKLNHNVLFKADELNFFL